MKNMQEEFVCEICDYKCSRKFCLQQHKTTSKHINATKSSSNATTKYVCNNCDKNFQHHSSLYRHQKICNSTQTINQDVVIELLKQNQDFTPLDIENAHFYKKQHKETLV